MKGIQQFGHLIAASVIALAVASVAPAQAQNVTIIVNGQQVAFDQPPIERSGRVFVPLRGVFERLGATVVYDNGVINATGSGHSISLHIGSTVAIVDNNQQTLDVAPFLVGARTLVPLRFISQALGAYVDYNGNTQTVTISMSGGGTTPPLSLIGSPARAPNPCSASRFFPDTPTHGWRARSMTLVGRRSFYTERMCSPSIRRDA